MTEPCILVHVDRSVQVSNKLLTPEGLGVRISSKEI